MESVDPDSWLEQELAELDEAQQFIHKTMSDFVPASRKAVPGVYGSA